MNLEPKVDRAGRVTRDDRMLGWVDHYDPTKRNKTGSAWRGVKEGGISRSGFRTRRDAAAWVAEP